MENNAANQQDTNITDGFTSPESILDHWQGHRRLTRKVIEAFPERELFDHCIGGMRPFAEMIKEIIGIADAGMQDLFTSTETPINELSHHSGKSFTNTKEDILNTWDDVTYKIDCLWPLIPRQRFHETMKAFGTYEGITSDIIFYWIDNEIHHRAQGYVYLRSLGIQPPAFWDRH
ncbi:MAG: damage-inducible protein DinB [Bacteroidetes bacterium]|jgi:uncharacterized damage-inducible protein DinB|nr:damage-inducible protein DinB [Bacteroidota bacterium]